ncbi:hypothetical protein L9F63_006280, partial [Diploptera punctata]
IPPTKTEVPIQHITMGVYPLAHHIFKVLNIFLCQLFLFFFFFLESFQRKER